jgi:hypothetical protein
VCSRFSGNRLHGGHGGDNGYRLHGGHGGDSGYGGGVAITHDSKSVLLATLGLERCVFSTNSLDGGNSAGGAMAVLLDGGLFDH